MTVIIDQKSGDQKKPGTGFVPAARPPSSIRRQDTFLNHSILLEERSSPNLLRWVVLVVLIVLTAFVAWASIARMKEMAQADGEVISTAPMQRVQHLEGGIVADIAIEDGQIVERGDVLVRLETRAIEAERAALAVRAYSLALDAERLSALLEGRRPDFEAVGTDGPGDAVPSDAAPDPMIATQQALYEGQWEAGETRRAVLESQIDTFRHEIATSERVLHGAQTVLSLVDEERTMRRQLAATGAASRLQVIEADLRHTDAQTDLGRAEGEIVRLEQSIAETERRLAELDANLRTDYLGRRDEVLREHAELVETIGGLDDRLARAAITAPTKGVVTETYVDTIGGVIAPGAEIARIAAIDSPMQITARLDPRDIAVIDVGDPVIIRIPALDFAQLGGIDGRIDDILPGTFVDEGERSYFKAFVSVDEGAIPDDPSIGLLPGMTAQVDVITGEKTLLEYLFKPLRFIQDRLFTER